MKIKEILLNGIKILKESNIEEANMKAKIILANLLGKNREYLIFHDEEEIEEGLNKIFFEKIERLKKHEPLQYIINKQEFMGLNFYVDENVLIPQPDTENLVEEVIHLIKSIIKNNKSEIKVLDMCTGSGAIAISISKYIENENVKIYASDISLNAIKIAQKNSLQNNIFDIEFIESDLFNSIDEKLKFDIIVSNPPYIESKIISQLSQEVQKEPIIALDGGEDGLDFYKKIIIEAKKYLNKDGILAFEIGYNQKISVENLFKVNYYKNIYTKKDLADNDRIVVGQI